MKKFNLGIFTILFLILISSCKSYQLVTLSSDLKKSSIQEFVFENDQLIVYYSFQGKYGPVLVRVFNKRQEPLFIYWSKSAALVYDDSDGINSHSPLFENVAYGIDSNTLYDNSVLDTNFKNGQTSVVPPLSYRSFVLTKLRFSLLGVNNYQSRNKVVLNTNIRNLKGMRYTFSADSTPLEFKCLMTLSFKPDMSDPVYVNNTFWVSDIIQTMVPPRVILDKPFNQFYLKKQLLLNKPIDFGSIAGWTLILGLGAILWQTRGM